MSFSGYTTAGDQGSAVYYAQPKFDDGSYLHMVRTRKDASQSQGSTATDVTEMNLELKAASTYCFSYDVIYSISGLFVGAQFAVNFTGTTVSCGYSIMMASDASSITSNSTTTVNTFVGSGSSFSGGGPWSARITGAIKTGGTVGGDLVLRMKGSGAGVTMTIQANTYGIAEEM